MKKEISIVIVLSIIVVFGFWGTYISNFTPEADHSREVESGGALLSDASLESITITFPDVRNTQIQAEIADDLNERTRGLSGREQLKAGNGLLFVFPKSDQYSFWMKDMNFAIDIIWIDEFGEIVHLETNVRPETYPQSFKPTGNALYVLEVNAGVVDNSLLKVGDTLIFDTTGFLAQ